MTHERDFGWNAVVKLGEALMVGSLAAGVALFAALIFGVI